MKLLIISQDYPPEPGGVQQYTLCLAKELGNHFDVGVLAPLTKGAAAFDRDQPFLTWRYPCPGTSSFGLLTPALMPRVARRFGAKIVLYAQHTTAMGASAARSAGAIERYYVSAHGRELLRANVPWLGPLARRMVLSSADGVFAVSRFTAGLAQQCGVASARLHVVPNGVDVARFSRTDASQLRARLGLGDKRIVLSAARLVRRKGIDTVIEAMKLLGPFASELTLVIVGEGDDRARLERLACPLVEARRVIFTGRVPSEELAAYYSLADVFVLPSRQERDGCVEGFGLVFLEAGACSTPVIGARSGGIPDAVEDGENGLLVPPNDAAALAEALTRILRDPALSKRLGEGGRERAQRFTWTAAAQRMADVITRG